ncbi:citrate transporter [uncultured Thiodictyon sp.]|uniref:citrate transporter n=1 Tax=uncultured Thiodictyon sp. TaxID=1846217 RepID=UPI0025FC75B6|nr:citrate transporter [uncultured Thiodictyon sp.]
MHATPNARTRRPLLALVAMLIGGPALAAAPVPPTGTQLFGIPTEFILFAATLLGVASFHRHTLVVALTGLAAITGFKLAVTGFHAGPGLTGLLAHLGHEWVILANLLGLLLGFALLARHFEDSRIPLLLPRFLPAGWPGGFVLLVMIFVLSSFLDNIAAALIGGTVAAGVFGHRVHLGYLAAIVAAANAGGAGSVVGDTTTTMMWISGIGPLEVVHAYIAAGVALAMFGIPAAIQQQRCGATMQEVPAGVRVDWTRVGIVATILGVAVATNVLVNLHLKAAAGSFPFLGAAVWVAILATAALRRPDWGLLPEAFKGSLFLLSLVICASMMPVEQLPPASWPSALALGFVSAVFDNIPLTALALKQGGYDWGVLAYAVGFGGSMIWFGSSAGVALSNLYPQAKSVGGWVRDGWHVILAYVLGFAALLSILGWQPRQPPSGAAQSATAAQCCASSHCDPPAAGQESHLSMRL